MSETITAPTPQELAKACEPLNQLERELAQAEPVICRVVNLITKGLYSRQITMPALPLPLYTVISTEIHKTEHQYVISKGKLDVWTQEKGWVRYEAPFHGITKPGARRALRIIETTIWTTFHPTDKTDLNEILHDLIEAHSQEQEELRAAWNKQHSVNQLMEGA